MSETERGWLEGNDARTQYERQQEFYEGTPCPKHRALGVNDGCPDCDAPAPPAEAAASDGGESS